MYQPSVEAASRLETTINDFRSDISSSMTSVEQTTQTIQGVANEIHDKVNTFKNTMITSEETQLAQENIIRIDQTIKEQFGDYDRIRRAIMGVVMDFDINLVRNKTIGELSEELWLTSSRYWLSYALIAVSAWVNNYPEVASNALGECARRDGIKASLFFTLLNLRFGRNETARHWFAKYLKTLDPKFMDQEASVVLQAYLAGVFGTDKGLEAQVNQTVDEWIAVISEDAQSCQELVDAYAKFFEALRPARDFTLDALKQFCENAEQVGWAYTESSKLVTLKAFVDSLDVQQVEQRPDNYKARVDAVLKDLITDYDQEENELKTQKKYYSMVIKHNGVVDEAEQEYQEMLRLRDQGYNVGRQFLNWVLYANSNDIDVHVRKFALGRTKTWFSQALTTFTTTLEQNAPKAFQLSIDGWKGVTDGSDEQEQLNDMHKHFEERKPSIVFFNMPNIIAFVLAVVCGGLAFLNPLFLVGTGVAVVFIGVHIYLEVSKYPKRVQQNLQMLQACMQQIGMYRNGYAEGLSNSSLVQEQIEYNF